MKCPACQQVMECLPGNRYQFKGSVFWDMVHFHCVNEQCPARMESNYISHVSILDRLSFGHSALGEWCYEYHLPFRADGRWYYLIGQQEAFRGTILRTADNPEPITLVSFLQIRAEPDLDQWAWKAFTRLKNLLVFS